MARLLIRVVVLSAPLALWTASCSSDPVVDEPALTGVATVRDLEEIPPADLAAPEVSGPRTVRFGYPLLSCEEVPGLPVGVEATYTDDAVAITVTPPRPGCGPTEDPGETTQGLELFLAEPVDDRDVTGRVVSP